MSITPLRQIDAIAREIVNEIEEMWLDIDELSRGAPGLKIGLPNRKKAQGLLRLLEGGEPLKQS